MSYKELAFIGGAVGYFGYDIGCFIENIPHITIDDVKMPDCFLGFYDGIYIFDHKLPIMYIAVLGINGNLQQNMFLLLILCWG